MFVGDGIGFVGFEVGDFGSFLVGGIGSFVDWFVGYLVMYGSVGVCEYVGVGGIWGFWRVV